MMRAKSLLLTGCLLGGTALSGATLANDGPLGLFNPLGLYVGAGVGRSALNQTQFDDIGEQFHHIDGNPVGWNAVIGLRPLPVLGVEAEYIDFGNSHAAPGLPALVNGATQQYLGGEVRDKATAVFAVGYLPLPIPYLEPFAKLGWAQIWEQDSYSGIYNDVMVNGAPAGQISVARTTHPTGAAYGGGVQVHIEQLAIRAQYERISGSRAFGGWNNPALLSVGLDWTF